MLRSPHGTMRSPVSAKKAAAESTVFGYSPPPEIGLGRDVYKFLQRLDLSCPIKSPRRDLSNGFYVAEILSRFFAADIQMHSYQNGTSERCKRDNWEQIKRVCQKNELSIPSNVIEGTIHGEPGAAVSLMELLYEKFTGKKVHRVDPEEMQGLGAAASAAAAATSAPDVSFGEPAASENGVLKAIKSSGGAAVPLEFGAVQTQLAGDAAALRRKYAAGSGSGA